MHLTNTKRYKGPDSHSSESVGVIRQVRTANANMTGRNVEASKDDPRYEVCLPYNHSPNLFLFLFSWLGSGQMLIRRADRK